MENNCATTSKCTWIISSAILAIGLIIGLFAAGYQIKSMRAADRFVEVKGLDERVIKSDYVSWVIYYKSSGATLEQALAGIEKSQASVIQFLTKNGFTEADIERGQVKIVDKQADAYNNNVATERYVIDSNITLRTDKVEEVVKLSQNTLDLAKSGVTISSDYGNFGPKFEFRGLNKIKPEMIANATKDARRAADQFAKDSGAKIGSIRNASQGYFSVESLSAIEGQTSLNQRVRVVSTIQFYLGE